MDPNAIRQVKLIKKHNKNLKENGLNTDTMFWLKKLDD